MKNIRPHSGGPAAWLSVLAFLSVSARMRNQKPNEYQVKAVYLTILADSSNGRRKKRPPKMILSTSACLARILLGPALDATLRAKTINGKSVVARRISTPQESDYCRILFMSSAEDGRNWQSY